MKLTTITGLAIASLAAGCCVFNTDDSAAKAVSPDGCNEIRLWANPLSYEVVRNGRVIVAKSRLGVKQDGACLVKDAALVGVTAGTTSGKIKTPVYKKAEVDLAGNWTCADFGAFAVRLAARDDGVAYRLELKKPGVVSNERADLAIPCPNAVCRVNYGSRPGCEETVNKTMKASEILTSDEEKAENKFVYLPLVYTVGDTTVAVTESDVNDYPIWELKRTKATEGEVTLNAFFPQHPKKQFRAKGWGKGVVCEKGGRWVKIAETEDYLVKADAPRTLPWRTFVLADRPADLCSADIVYALARPAAAYDFSWVSPGKVAWDWWNAWDCQGQKGCNTKTYERFIDFASKKGVEYVIFDEGWSEELNIWKFHKDVDVPHLIKYAEKRGVGIILWMAWAQVYGEEAKVAEHFGKLGAKGFKVDFMDRGDADVERFLWKFADECAKRKLLVDYHGAHRPTGMERAYPNVLNYEGVHGLEVMKWFRNNEDYISNDIKVFFARMTAGPLDYTPGAMDNYRIGEYKGNGSNPGSVGTRCHQVALMSLYFAPLQMLCDSPTKYEANDECFSFMAATPVTWDDTIGLDGTPETFAACARRKGDIWYASGITNFEPRDYTLDTSFLGSGEWTAEIFRDAPDSDREPTHYVRQIRRVKAGDRIALQMAPGGGFAVRFVK